MRVGEAGGGDQQRAGLWFDLAVLVHEFGFAFLELVVEVQRPQQMPVQGFAARVARVLLAVPVRVAAFVGAVPLQVDAGRAQTGADQFDDAGVVLRDHVFSRQPPQFAVRAGLLEHQWRDQGLGIFAQIADQAAEHRHVQGFFDLLPFRVAGDGDVAAVLEFGIDAAADLSGAQPAALADVADDLGAALAGQRLRGDGDEILVAHDGRSVGWASNAGWRVA